jgi:excisionase family DNA binding protein
MGGQLIDVNEGAKLTGLRPQTLYRLARQGRLTRFRVLRRSIRFDRSEVLALVRGRASDEAPR